jgi:hypothetical protein
MTFLHDALAYAKGPYFRHVGRHTKNFCMRASRQAKTTAQRRVWLSTAISADEVIASLAHLEKRRPLGPLESWKVRPKVKPANYLRAMRVYLSTLLLLYGSCKDELIEKTGMPEGEFMKSWQNIFQYNGGDQTIFDQALTPAYREGGLDGLVRKAGELIREALFTPDSPLGQQELASLQDLMVDDLTALRRNLAGSDDADRARQG